LALVRRELRLIAEAPVAGIEASALEKQLKEI